MKKIILILILFYSSNIFSSTLVVNKVFPATVLITAEDKNGQAQSLGSGFLVAPNIIATNLHVIENSYSGYVKFVNKKEIYEIEGVVGYNENYDLALIKISNNNATPLPLLSPSVDIGQKIFAIGNPLGLEGTISDGIISGLREFKNFSVLQISAPISPGNSGGPVVNENGDVVGVATFTMTEGQNINFAVPVKYLKEVISNQVEKITLSNLVSTKKPNNNEIKNTYDGVTIAQAAYEPDTGYFDTNHLQFSIKNNLRKKVCDILYIWIFYDGNQEPFNYIKKEYSGCIEPKLATRYKVNLKDDFENYLRATNAYVFDENWKKNIFKFIEVRVLDYQVKD